MKSKFDFYEIVRVCTINKKKISLNGKCGYIAAKSEPDLNINKNKLFSYVVEFPDITYSSMFEENELESTQEFFDKTKIPNHGSIRIAVDDNGVGSVKASYNSYTEIENAISRSQASKASGYMIEAGMTSNDLDIMYNLIFIAIQHPDYIIRSSGYSALWHLLLRFKNKVSSQVLMKTLRIGLTDKNEHVLKTVNCIIEDLQNIAPDVLKQIEKYK